MNANLTLPLGLGGTLSVVFVNDEKVIIHAMNICAGNPTGFARKVCHLLKECSYESKAVSGTLSTNFEFTVTDKEWVIPFPGNPMGYLHGVWMILDNCLRTTDRFSV